eukprot:2124231-Prymnesium_polylepis.1
MSYISAHLWVRSNTSQRARRSDITPASHTRSQQSYFLGGATRGPAGTSRASPPDRAKKCDLRYGQ